MDVSRAADERDCEATVAHEVHFDRAVIDDILARVQAIAGRPFVIAIDGPGGSGKSTLAHQLEAEYAGNAAVVNGDDFYADLDDGYRLTLDAEGGYEGYFGWQRLRDEVFIPANEGLPISYQRYDWDKARMGDWRTVPPPLTSSSLTACTSADQNSGTTPISRCGCPLPRSSASVARHSATRTTTSGSGGGWRPSSTTSTTSTSQTQAMSGLTVNERRRAHARTRSHNVIQLATASPPTKRRTTSLPAVWCSVTQSRRSVTLALPSADSC